MLIVPPQLLTPSRGACLTRYATPWTAAIAICSASEREFCGTAPASNKLSHNSDASGNASKTVSPASAARRRFAAAASPRPASFSTTSEVTKSKCKPRSRGTCIKPICVVVPKPPGLPLPRRPTIRQTHRGLGARRGGLPLSSLCRLVVPPHLGEISNRQRRLRITQRHLIRYFYLSERLANDRKQQQRARTVMK